VYCISVSLARSLLMFCMRALAHWSGAYLLMILFLAEAFQFLIGLLLVLLPLLLLLLLPSLLHPNHQLGPNRALRLLEACVLVKVLAGVIDAEPLQWRGLFLLC
jgi:hypothetical protein